MMVDFSKFNWEEIFGVVVATDGLKRNQTRGLRTEIQEIATAKYSGEQFKYVGMSENGRDYVDVFGFYWEDKGQLNMFPTNSNKTKVFTLKNFQGNRTEYVKTFDYILLKDTKAMSVGWTDWDSVYKNIKIKDATIESYVNYDDLHMIDFFVKPSEKQDLSTALTNIIESII